MENDKLIEDFFKQQKYGVIATQSQQGQPQSALVGISVFDGFKLVFGTKDSTRKFQNIRGNSKASAVVGLGKEHQTIQMDGQARILEGDERSHYMDEHFKQQPWSRTYANDPGQNYILFEAEWVRYTDIDQKPELIIEKKLAN